MSSKLTPAEAGQRARDVAAAEANQHTVAISTRLAHAGISYQSNAPLAPPLHLATTYTRPANGIYDETDSIYIRHDNPTRMLLEKTVFDLDCHGLVFEGLTNPMTFAFSSGMMAASSIILAHTGPIMMIYPLNTYHGVPTVTVDVFSRHNVSMVQVDMSNISEIVEALETSDPSSQAIVWMETPSNPMCHVLDIENICKAIQSFNRQVTTVVDSTLAPQVLTQPLHVSINRQSNSFFWENVDAYRKLVCLAGR